MNRRLAGVILAGALGLCAPAAALATSAASAAPAAACTVAYHGITGLGEPGYASVHMITDNGCASYHSKALCKATPTSGVTVYGPSHSTPGYSRADCPGQDRVSSAWAVIGGTAYRFYPSAAHLAKAGSIIGDVHLMAAHPGHEIAPGLTGRALDRAVQAKLFGKPGSPPPPSSPNCLASDTSLCWASPGAGNQVYITSSGYAGMEVVNCTNYDQFTWCEFQNSNGHCFYDGYGGGSEPMNEGQNACTGGLDRSQLQYDLIDPVGNGDRLVPALETQCLNGACGWYKYWGVYNNESGKPVWAIPNGTPSWVTWTR